MAQGVELAVRQAVAVEKAAEPLRWSGRVHRSAISLNKQPVVAFPLIAELQARLVLFGAIMPEHIKAIGWEHDAADAAGLGGLTAHFRIAGELVVAAADSHHAGIKVDVAPFQPDQFSAAAACIQREVDHHTVLDRFTLERIQHRVNLAFVEDISDRLVLFRERDPVSVGRITGDQSELVGGVRQGTYHRVVAVDGCGGQFARRAVEPCVSCDKFIDEVLDMDGTNVAQLHVPEHRNDAEVHDVVVLFVDDRG